MENKTEKSHSLHISGTTITISAVTNVVSFDEKQVILNLAQGNVTLCGTGFEVVKLSVEEGIIELTGTVSMIKYSSTRKKESFIKRIIK